MVKKRNAVLRTAMIVGCGYDGLCAFPEGVLPVTAAVTSPASTNGASTFFGGADWESAATVQEGIPLSRLVKTYPLDAASCPAR